MLRNFRIHEVIVQYRDECKVKDFFLLTPSVILLKNIEAYFLVYQKLLNINKGKDHQIHQTCSGWLVMSLANENFTI